MSDLAEPIPAPVRGVLWMVGAGLSFAVMSALIRPAAAELHPFQVVFFRNLLGLALFGPWLLRGVDWRIWRSQSFKLHVLRAAVLLGAMLCWFTAIPRVKLTEAVALNFTAPMFVTVLAALILGETVRIRRLIAILAGFCGVLIVVRPGFHTVHLGQLLILADALLWAVAIILIRVLSRRESPQVIVAYMFILVLPFSAVPAALVWHWPSPSSAYLIAGIAIASTFGHYFSTRAFAIAEASVVMPFDYLRLIWFSLAGYLLFGELPDRWTVVGAGVIAAASLYLLHRERQLARGNHAAAAPGPLERGESPRP